MGWGAEAPDMSGANAAAVGQMQIAREQWADYRDRFAPRILQQMDDQIKIGKDTYELAREQQDFQLGLQRKFDNRYWGVQVPLEDSIIADAKNFDTAAERERMAGEARGDVAQAFGAQRAGLRREMGRMGVNPSDGKYFSMSQRMSADEALATAHAANKTREAARQMGWARKADAAALGRGLPGFSGGATQMAMGWGGQGMQGAGMGMNAIGQGAGVMNQTASSAGSNYQGAGSTYTNIAGIQQKSQAANMEMMGSVVGAAGKAFSLSDRRLKTDVVQVGTLANGLPVYSFRYKAGGPTVIGVMADEVARVRPEAVDPNYKGSGFSAVDYSMLGGL